MNREAQDPLTVSRHSGVEIDFMDGRYVVRRDGELRVSGSYRVTGDRITLTDAEGAWACTTPDTRSATYLWRMDGGRLVLTLAGQDACNRRRNRVAGELIRGLAALPENVGVPPVLVESWESFWLKSDEPQWIDRTFTTDAVAEDGNRRLEGIEQIRGWLGGQDSRDPRAFPFEFSHSGANIIEKGRYRDVFGSPDGSTRVLVGRYQITWVPAANARWQVREWILR